MATDRIDLARHMRAVYITYVVLGIVGCICVAIGASVTVYVSGNPLWSIWLVFIPIIIIYLMKLQISWKVNVDDE